MLTYLKLKYLRRMRGTPPSSQASQLQRGMERPFQLLKSLYKVVSFFLGRAVELVERQEIAWKTSER